MNKVNIRRSSRLFHKHIQLEEISLLLPAAPTKIVYIFSTNFLVHALLFHSFTLRRKSLYFPFDNLCCEMSIFSIFRVQRFGNSKIYYTYQRQYAFLHSNIYPVLLFLFNFGIIFYFRLFENVCFAVETCNTFFSSLFYQCMLSTAFCHILGTPQCIHIYLQVGCWRFQCAKL